MSEELGQKPLSSLTLPENAAIIAALTGLEAKEKQQAWRLTGLQTVIVLVVGVIVYLVRSTPHEAIAVVSGGGVAILNGALLAWRMSRAAKYPAYDAGQQLRLLYFYAAERISAVFVLLGICMFVLKLVPLALLSGFVLGQAVLLLSRLFLKIKTEDSD
ncbi:MAG: ATP synthase subunit I [Gallionella sp.]|nr:ATP synthase subunit I [Gallionella sp.]